MKARKGAAWNIKRARQLEKMETLVREVLALNRGNYVIERMQRCIDLAKQLDSMNMKTAEPSFCGFLTNLCIADRFPKSEKKP